MFDVSYSWLVWEKYKLVDKPGKYLILTNNSEIKMDFQKGNCCFFFVLLLMLLFRLLFLGYSIPEKKCIATNVGNYVTTKC